MRVIYILPVLPVLSLNCPNAPTGSTLEQYDQDQKCVYIFEEKMPWLVAEKECEKIRPDPNSENYGGMVTVHDNVFNDWLLEKLTRGFNPDYFYK